MPCYLLFYQDGIEEDQLFGPDPCFLAHKGRRRFATGKLPVAGPQRCTLARAAATQMWLRSRALRRGASEDAILPERGFCCRIGVYCITDLDGTQPAVI